MRRLFALSLALLLPTIAVAEDLQILPGYSDFRAPALQPVDRPIQIIADWLAWFPESSEGGPSIDFTAKFEGERFVMVLTGAGGGDDSVRAYQRRYEFIQTADGWMPIAFGHRQKCWRGATDAWVPGACP